MGDLADLTVRDFQSHTHSFESAEFNERIVDTTTVLRAAQTISGEIMGAPFEQSVTVNLPDQDDGNPEIERMWASHRVDSLLRDNRSGVNNGGAA